MKPSVDQLRNELQKAIREHETSLSAPGVVMPAEIIEDRDLGPEAKEIARSRGLEWVHSADVDGKETGDWYYTQRINR